MTNELLRLVEENKQLKEGERIRDKALLNELRENKNLKHRLDMIKELVDHHNGSDSHARKLFDKIEEIMETYA